MNRKPIIGITMGDPAGIGPEVILKALMKSEIQKILQPVLIGNEAVFQRVIQKYHFKLGIFTNDHIKKNIKTNSHIPLIASDTLKQIIKYGNWSKETGQTSLAAVRKGVELALEKKIDALVTAPICKEAWDKNGVHSGHTELLAKMTDTKDFSMMFTGGPFRIILVTIHQALAKVPKFITIDKVTQSGITGERTLREYFSIDHPRIAIAGLNPHAGENGLIGAEENKSIIPAIKILKKKTKGIISGPYPADTLFAEAVTGKFDLIICMYHDQGLIPFKMLAFHKGVNITAGLPIIRTSPDHGTGFNIAGKNLANPGSMIAALETAVEMTLQHKTGK